jgi:tetratricopeptide (TPR) repeat protein
MKALQDRTGSETAEAGGPAAAFRERDGRRRGRVNTCLLLALCATGLCLATVIALHLTGVLDIPLLRAGQQHAPLAAAPLGPVWTSTATWTARPPTPTTAPTNTLTSTQRLIGLEDEIRAAETLCLQCDYEQAISTWDGILRQVPDYGPGYRQRARAYLGLTQGERVYEVALENALHALNDIDTAIAIGDQVTGDYFLTRHDVYSELGVLEEIWADRQPLNRLALENLRMALALGNSDPMSPRGLVFELASLGDCDAALAEASRLYNLVEPGDPPSAGINTALANSYLCSGDYSQALAFLDIAIQISDTPERRFHRAVALFGLGRLEEALEELNAQIEARPTFDGFRYYLRALVYYDLGMPDLAREDLQTGAYNTWGRTGMATLVAGLLARDEGDRDGAIELLRLTEATIDRSLTPMLARTWAELAALGEQPLLAPSTSPTSATPMPTCTPQPDGAASLATPPAQLVDYRTGAGTFSFGGEDHWVFRFVSHMLVFVREVRSLAIRVDARFSASTENIDIFLWNPRENFWTMFPWEGGEILVGNPGRFVSPLGELFVAVTSGSGFSVTIDGVVARMEIVLPDGTAATLGPDAE